MMRWPWDVFKNELRQAVAYRLDFWLQFIGSIVTMAGVAYFLWGAIFAARGVTELQGFTFHGLMLYYVFVPLIDRLVRGYDNFQISGEVYDGSLTRFLVLPVNYFAYKYVAYLARSVISFLQLLMGVGGFVLLFGLPPEFHFSLASIFMGFSLCFVAGAAFFMIAFSVELIAFWADNVWTLMVLLRFSTQMLSGVFLPLAFFPETVQTILSFTIFPYVVSVPVRLFMGQASVYEWAQGLFVAGTWAVMAFVVLQWVWERGTRQYTGVGI